VRRAGVVLLLLLAVRVPGFAARVVNAAQLEQQLAAFRGKTDAEAARQIAELQLSERMSAVRLARLQAGLPGEKSRQALLALADVSAFLSPPAGEISAQAAPPLAEQKRIMGLVVGYVAKTLPQLPNFLATRVTSRFEDTPQRTGNFTAKYEPLHPAAKAIAQVTYRDGREVAESAPDAAKHQAAGRGLRTWGEFGPILSTVLVDASRNKLGWLRWEQGAAGPVAVFAYGVAPEKSQYEVEYCCVADSLGQPHVFRRLTGYHGEMTVDPASGAILRLQVQADLKPGEPVAAAGMVVEYGPVEIGGRTYICPVRSVALTRAQSVGHEQQEMVQTTPHGQGMGLASVAVGAGAEVVEQTLLNDVAFADYHVFRGEGRMIAEEEAKKAGGAMPAAVPTAPASTERAQASAQEEGKIPQLTAPDEQAKEAPPATPAMVSAAPVTAPEVPPAGAGSESASPDLPRKSAASAPDSGVTLRITTRLVDVPVVAFDRKGRLVTDLTPGELEVYDNGRRQEVRFFSQSGREISTGSGAQAASAIPVREAGDAPAEVRSERDAASAGDTAVLLIDAAHVAFGDLTYARGEMLRFLKTVQADERVALYILKSTGVEVLLEPTTDHAKIAERLARWMPSAQDLLNAQREEARNRQQMDYVQNVTDIARVNGNNSTGQGDIYLPVDPQLRSLGDNPGRDSLSILAVVARHLAAFPGHKSLVWIASDNVLADFSEKAPSNEKGGKQLDPLALQAREALNEAHVSIYPLDASQLEAGGVSADMRSANVQVKPKTNEQVQLLMLPPELREEVKESVDKSKRDIYPGRVSATLQQDTHPIQGVYRDLAEATGGRAFRRAGDIAAELDQAVADGRAAYLLSFRPDGPPDDAYHMITVKCTRPEITLRYRTGYVYGRTGKSG